MPAAVAGAAECVASLHRQNFQVRCTDDKAKRLSAISTFFDDAMGMDMNDERTTEAVRVVDGDELQVVATVEALVAIGEVHVASVVLNREVKVIHHRASCRAFRHVGWIHPAEHDTDVAGANKCARQGVSIGVVNHAQLERFTMFQGVIVHQMEVLWRCYRWCPSHGAVAEVEEVRQLQPAEAFVVSWPALFWHGDRRQHQHGLDERRSWSEGVAHIP